MKQRLLQFKYYIRQLSNRLRVAVLLGVILFFCSLVFLFNVVNDAKQQYLHLGGLPEELTLGRVVGLSSEYFKSNYFKSAEQKQKEIQIAEQQEQARLNLPMNQNMRRTFFKNQPYILSLAIPRTWEGRFESREVGNRLEINFINGTSTWPMLNLTVIDRRAVLKSEEQNIVKLNEVTAVLADRKNAKIKSATVDKLYQKMKVESEEIIKSIKIYKNQ